MTAATLLAFATISLAGDQHALGEPGKALAKLLRARGHVVTMDGRVGARANETYWSCDVSVVRLVFLGSNETPSAYTRTVYEDLQAIVIGPPRSRRSRVEAMGRLLAGAKIRRYVDSRPCTDASWTTDGLHYGAEGGRRWAECILPRVLEHLR